MKKTFTLLSSLALSACLIVNVSCKKEQIAATVNSVVDIRDGAVATYNGTAVTTVSGNTMPYAKAVTLSKASDNKLTISIGTDVTFTTDVALGTTSTFAGSIPSQSVTYKGASATLEGKGVAGQHFAFTSSINSFTFSVTITEGTTTTDITFTGTK